jgi:nascent polypeptide-associated complex subunit alpha
MSQDEQPKIEVVPDTPPPLEEVKGGAAAGGSAAAGAGFEGGDRGQSKSEKKTRKAVEKLGLKRVSGIARVTIKKQKTVFSIAEPDVYKAGKDGYVVFGEAKIEDASAQSLQEVFANMQAQQAQAAAGGAAAADDDDQPPPLTEVKSESSAPAAAPATPAAAASAAPGDEAGVEAKDIELVMAQVNCTRAQAVAALRKNENDIVNAIMSLQI